MLQLLTFLLRSNVLFMDIHTPTFSQYTQFSHTQIILANPSSTFMSTCNYSHGCATLSTVNLPSSDIFTLHLAWFVIKREDLASFFLEKNSLKQNLLKQYKLHKKTPKKLHCCTKVL